MIDHYTLNNDITFLAKSEIRLKILTELNNRPQTVKEIVDKTNMVYSSVSNNLNKDEDITSIYILTEYASTMWILY